MIQTKFPIVYQDRGDAEAIIKLEIFSFYAEKEKTVYLVHDYTIIDDVQEIYKAKEVAYSNQQINDIDAFILANYNLSGLSKTEREWKKIAIALMLDTKTNLLENSGKTIYRLEPDDWEFSPQPNPED